MTRAIHAWWQVVAVVLFTTVLVLQIPRKALFFVPSLDGSGEPFVSIVSFDDEAYSRLVRRMRMSWQIHGRTMAGGMADSRIDAFSFADPLPPPVYLKRREKVAGEALPTPSPLSPPELMPPTLAAEIPPMELASLPPERDQALLSIPEGLPTEPPPADFKLSIERTIK